MSRTKKDLKSHKIGFGKYGHKPTRKLTPFIYDANKITGENEVLPGPPNNDIKEEDFEKHYHNAKSVRARRKQIRFERDYTTSRARTKIKQHDKKNLNNECK